MYQITAIEIEADASLARLTTRASDLPGTARLTCSIDVTRRDAEIDVGSVTASEMAVKRVSVGVTSQRS